MRLHIRHRTAYRYTTPISYSIQELRLTPLTGAGQTVLSWKITGETRESLPFIHDGYGNIVHTHTVNGFHQQSVVTVDGYVETEDCNGLVQGNETLPPAFYLRQTELTTASGSVHALARSFANDAGVVSLSDLHDLMAAIRDRVDYELGATGTHTAAIDVLAKGAGVCQDHSNVFVACCRAIAVPARYVGGYMWTGDDVDATAGHAWAEAYLPDLGWIGFDVANRVCPTDAYVRAAYGLDSRVAAPVRGVWFGAGREDLDVRVNVQQMAAQQTQGQQ